MKTYGMKISELGKDAEFSVYGLTRTHLRMRNMKLSVGECSE